jgi:hypothetical protein
LFGIPLIGWLVCLIFAFGGTRYRNKRNFARALLVLAIIGIVVSTLIYFALRWTIGAAMDAAIESSGDSGGGLAALKQFLEAALQYVNGLIAAQGN